MIDREKLAREIVGNGQGLVWALEVLAPILNELEVGRTAVDNEDPAEDARLYKLYDDARKIATAHLAQMRGE